jgi:xyloglucan-specific exo-beta-1,4-glucanase
MSRFASNKKGSSTGWIIAAVVIIVIIIVVGVLSYELTLPTSPSASPTPSPTPTISPTPTTSTSPSPGASPTPTPSSTPSGTTIDLTLYAGSVSSSTFGYGDSSNSIQSPGPTLKLKSGQTYKMTVHNVATNLAHSWEIVPTKAVSESPMFGAGIDINTYIQPGQSGSVTFTPDQTGSFYYVCTVPGHIALGMWGTVEIT